MPREHMVVICVRWLEKQVFLGRLEGLHHVRPATEGCVFDNRSLVMCSHLEVGVRELSGSLNSNSPPDNAADHNREEKHDWSFALCLSPPVIFFSQQQGGRVWRRLSVNHTADRNQTRLQSFPKQQHKKALIKHELRHMLSPMPLHVDRELLSACPSVLLATMLQSRAEFMAS